MDLREYRVENIGLFKGEHRFDLRTVCDNTGSKPIILVGGKNGAGKTTLFEGVRMCLYGRFSKGYKLSDSEYEGYLKSKIHKRAELLDAESASVSLEFDHSHLGKVSRYFVKRSWSLTEKTSEELNVLQDGKPLENLPKEQLQDFLMELIPIGVSKLFFFDGEQIQNLAEDESDNRHLKEAFDSLLGLNILQQLDADIRIYLSKNSKIDRTDHEKELTILRRELRNLELEAQSLRDKKARSQRELDSTNSQIESLEREIASQGGGFASKREQLRIKRDQLLLEVKLEEDRIREIASGLFPFSIAPDYCQKLKIRLQLEEQHQRTLLANDALFSTITEINKKSESEEFWEGTVIRESERKEIISRITKIIRSIASIENKEDFYVLLQLSPEERQKILGWIDLALRWVPAELKTTTLRLESKIRELHEVQVFLTSAPPDETLAPLVQSINKFHEKLGGLKKEIAVFDESKRSIDFKIKEVNRRIEKIQESQKEEISGKDRFKVATKVQDVLREFRNEIKKRKIKEVSERFVDAYNSLASKKNMIEKVQIDEETLSVHLLNKNGLSVPKKDLSAGEKQIYAISMLMSLAYTSGRPLPFIIDTPLARLDSEHRANIVRDFFPKVSHQAIVFSTDTEIDQRYFSELEPFISRAYLLHYEQTDSSSIESEGYFWKSPSELVKKV